MALIVLDCRVKVHLHGTKSKAYKANVKATSLQTNINILATDLSNYCDCNCMKDRDYFVLNKRNASSNRKRNISINLRCEMTLTQYRFRFSFRSRSTCTDPNGDINH